MRPRSLLSVVTSIAACAALAVTGGPAFAAPHAAPADASVAPGAPGVTSYFDLARKDCVGTAHNRTSKVWYTVAGGVLSDVYNPTIDNTNVHTLQYIVTDGHSFTDLQQRDTSYTVSTDPTGMACTVTATSTAHHYRLITTYITDPDHATVLMHTRIEGGRGLHVYVRLDPIVNGNGGGGDANGGADSAVVDTSTGSPVPVAYDQNTTTIAANRDYAVPEYVALRADRPMSTASVGYAGTDSDGLSMLDANHSLTTYDQAPNGHVVATAELQPKGNGVMTLALGFGRTQAQAVSTAGASLGRAFPATYNSYVRDWRQYDRSLVPVSGSHAADYYRAANVLAASEDKTFPGAVVASLSSPWGQAVPANTVTNGKPVYFGSYREVFARDLYEAFTGFLTDGDLRTARATTWFLFTRQQQPDGSMPRNSLLNGQVAPDTGGIQLDETAYPILMARQSGLSHDSWLYTHHIRPAADFLVSHGPSYGNERWEEQSGYSPSTIAAEIAGLVAASAIADDNGDHGRAAVYLATADDFQRHVKDWTVTTTGPYANGRYFLRLSKTGDPNAAITYNLGNGGPTVDQRAVIDQGFVELTRLGELPATDPDVLNSLKVVDSVIRQSTPNGDGIYRYGTSTPGSEDGYGDCWEPDPTDCTPSGKPWPTGNVGSGHLWPVLDGERAEQDLASRRVRDASTMLDSLLGLAGPTGLVPEQDWEDPNLPADSWQTQTSDPQTASIGFVDGQPAGSANPLTWAMGQEVRLIRDFDKHRIIERPADTAHRYLTNPPTEIPLTLSAPAGGSTVGGTTTVSGTTVAGATVQILTVNTFTGKDTIDTTTARADGTFRTDVSTPFGSDIITAAVVTATGSGYAQVTVSSTAIAGTTVLDVSDPTGDDNGPGTYGYPTAPDFQPGAFDVTHFSVTASSDVVYLQVQLRNLSPTFGSPIGAQLVDVYVHQPNASAYSTAAAYPQRNYTVDPGWSERIEVQGFAAPVFVDAGGNSLGNAQYFADQTTRTITIAVPTSAFGMPTSGWSFALTVTGQDGFSPDQARGFAATPQPYLFGVCTAGETSPICSVDPGSVPKVVDTVTPSGVSQDAELDPTGGHTPVVTMVPVP